MQSKFYEYHPIINFLFFTITIAFSMFVLHPVFLGISLINSITYSIILNGRKAIKFNILYILPTMVIAILINALTNRRGTTVIMNITNNITITYEALLFGIAAAVMIVCVICWFSCYNKIMTTDKFIYIFGKSIPSLSLVFSMIFRFVPRFKAQFKKTVNAQKCIGNDAFSGNIANRLKSLLKIVSIMMSWALENSIETADSMKGRGYGLKGRTAFSIYKFGTKDWVALIYIILSAIYIFTGIIRGGIEYTYYPKVTMQLTTPYAASIFFAYGLLCIMPIIIELLEDIKWKYLKSTI